MTGISYEIARIVISENFCLRCDRVTTFYGDDCQGCCSPEPRPVPMLPRESGLTAAPKPLPWWRKALRRVGL